MTDAELHNWFSYHAPTNDQKRSYETIREAGKLFARLIRDHTPECPDQTAAIRKIREAVMTANAAIACYMAPLERSVVDAMNDGMANTVGPRRDR
jgi:hypothetical protein